MKERGRLREYTGKKKENQVKGRKSIFNKIIEEKFPNPKKKMSIKA